jgi:hypothetical protein
MTAATANRTFQPVRRESYDVDDPRAQVFAPIEGGIKFVDAYLGVFDEWADVIKKKGAQHELSRNCRKVLEKLLLRCTDFKTGISEPCLDTLMRHTRFARATVVRSLAALAKHGFVDWVRRTTPTDNAPGDGPQVRQVSNAYFFDLARLNKRVLMALRQRLRKQSIVIGDNPQPRRPIFGHRKARTAACRRDRWEDKHVALAAARTLEEKAAILYPDDVGMQAEWLAMSRVSSSSGASSGNSLNPSPSTLKG